MKRAAIISLMTALCITAAASAKSNGAYFGGGVGQSFVQTNLGELEDTDLTLNENGFAYKLLAGVIVGNHLSFEGSYRSFGTVKNKIAGVQFESNLTGYDLYALGRLDLALFELFAKAGYTFWDQQNYIASAEKNKSGSNFSWGFGAVLKLGGIGVRAEWERFEIASYDRLSMLTAGIVFGM